ncbi:EthD family reductase [uncultured Arthrobacter sp.]|uniref:EthD family reductase n=1 Tax=uncultured Arthrobacter sp. TaxID=114050 RepID=UPI0025D24D14|nr:EthD family reductase [uncultured Arthrobacter sp.]
MQTKITVIINNPTDPEAFEREFPELLTIAKSLPGQLRLESAKVWPKEDGTPTPAYRTLDFYFESYDAASQAVSVPQAGQFFQKLGEMGGTFMGLFSEVEQ